MHFCPQGPFSVAASAHIVDEHRIEIVDCDIRHLLQHDARAEGIAATYFTDITTPGQHLADKFVTGEKESETARIVIPYLIGHQAKRGQTDCRLQVQAAI